MITINSLKLKNFFSHRCTDLSLKEHEGLIMIEGINDSGMYSSNGSGKSTILEGIVYALSGNTLRNVSVNEVVNRNSKGETEVSLEFSKDSSTYSISRYRKSKEKGNTLEIHQLSGEETSNLSKRLNQDTQEFLDSIIEIPYNTLINTILLGEGLSSRFTQLSDSDKKSLVESTMNFSYDLEKSRSSVSTTLKEMKLNKSNIEGKISVLEESISESAVDITSEVSTLQDKCNSLKRNIESLNGAYEEKKIFRSSLDPKIALIRNTLLQYDALRQSLDTIDTETASLVKELTKVTTEESPHCSLCHQELISEESKNVVTQKLNKDILSNTESMKELYEKISKIPDRPTLESKYKELMESSSKITQELEDIQVQIRNISLSLNSTEMELEKKKSSIENREVILQKISQFSENLRELTVEIYKYEYLYKLYSPTGIINYILEEALSYINERLLVYTSILLDKQYKLVLQKGKISLDDERGSSYQSLSNGEKRRLDLCIQFSLHDYTHMYCKSSMNILFLDEILDTLDTVGVENIMEVLTMKKEYCNLSAIFVITHNDSLKSMFDGRITVRKNLSGDSYIENK